MKFQQWLDENWEEGNLLPPELEPQQAIDFLCEYLLGKNWYITLPLSVKQANCEIVESILYNYSKKYRDELKRGDK